ncbi:MAG: DNA repair protein RecO [Bacilli bacterium]|nr:DNA repair protein RecO [Bacilli bacterium]
MATRENKRYTGFVYRQTPIKEKDAMVSCIGEEGFFSFFARGVMNPASKDFAVTQEGSYGEFELNVSTQDALRLKEGRWIASYRKDGDYEATFALQALFEILSRAVPEEDSSTLYPFVEAFLKALKQGGDPYTLLAILLAKTLMVEGYGPTIDSCAVCGKKEDIVAFSPEAGGLLCREDAETMGVAKMPVSQLRAYRAVFLVPPEKFGTFTLPKLDLLPILSLLGAMVEGSVGVSLKSLATILRYQ